VNALVHMDQSTLFKSRPPMLVVAAPESFPSTDTRDERVMGPALETIGRIRRDFGLLPGLALTLPQARRLWALQDAECRALLDALVAEGFLRVRSDARYVMREASRTRPVVPAYTGQG
jgi:hypothetical protein